MITLSAQLSSLSVLDSATALLSAEQLPISIDAAKKEKESEVYLPSTKKLPVVVMNVKVKKSGRLYEAKELSMVQLQSPKFKESFELVMQADDMAQARKLAKDLEMRRADRGDWSGMSTLPESAEDLKQKQFEGIGEFDDHKEKFPTSKGAGDMGDKVKPKAGDPLKVGKLKASVTGESALPEPQSNSSEREVKEFSIEDIGVEHSQSFPGRGTSPENKWEAVQVGIGESPREAANDALEALAMDDWKISPELEAAVDALAETPTVSEHIEKNLPKGENLEEALENSELYYHVAISVK
jgi:hypothetical protein